MGARFYDPSIGRWLSEDPARSFEPMSLNFYAYVANNPLVLIDPTGMMSTGPEGGGCGGDLGCLNEQRQSAAMAAVALEALDPTQSAVENYKGYLADSRARGHLAAMADLVEKVLAAASMISSGGIVQTSAVILTADEVRSIYYKGAGYMVGGAALMALGIATSATLLGPVLFETGAFAVFEGYSMANEARDNDLALYEGQVLESLDPLTREFLRAVLRR